MSAASPKEPLFFGQARYHFELLQNPSIRYYNPTFRESLRCDRSFAFWLIVEERAVHDLHDRLVWYRHTVGRYHRTSLSRRKIKRWVKDLNGRPIDDFFFKDTQMNGHVVIYHKRRILCPAPMKTRSLGLIVEDKTVDYKILFSPVEEQDLINSELKLEEAVCLHNKLSLDAYQGDYFLSLRGQVFNNEAQLLQRKIAGENVVIDLPRMKVSDKSGRLAKSLRSIGGY